jgi:hypothetical protein
VLIDSDNARASMISDLPAEVAQVGTATVKRAYGDWTTPQLGSWKEVLHVHAIVTVQQFSRTAAWLTASAWCRPTATSPAGPPASASRDCW